MGPFFLLLLSKFIGEILQATLEIIQEDMDKERKNSRLMFRSCGIMESICLNKAFLAQSGSDR